MCASQKGGALRDPRDIQELKGFGAGGSLYVSFRDSTKDILGNSKMAKCNSGCQRRSEMSIQRLACKFACTQVRDWKQLASEIIAWVSCNVTDLGVMDHTLSS